MRTRRRVPALALAGLLSALAAGGEEPQPFPAGAYTFEITAAEVPADAPEDIRSLLVGEHVMTFTADGKVSRVVGGKLHLKGRYASTPEHLVITDEEGPGQCQAERATGIYKWKREGDDVRLTTVEDLCRWRAFAVTREPWRVQGGSPAVDSPAPAVPADHAPVPLRLTKPAYPQKAFMEKIEGTVIVEIVIGTDGNVTRARVVQSVPGLDEAALRVVYEWKFKPAIKNGKPVATIANAPVAFRIFDKKKE